MIKKNARKPRGAAAIAVIDDDLDDANDDVGNEANGSRSEVSASATKPGRRPKAKPNQQSNETFGVSDIKKGAAFVNSIGGLEKAIAVLHILKVAKEVQ